MRAIYSQLPMSDSSIDSSKDVKNMVKRWANYITENEEPETVEAVMYKIKNDLDIDIEHLRNKLTLAFGDTVLIKETLDDKGEEQLSIILPKTHFKSNFHLKKTLTDELEKIKKKK